MWLILLTWAIETLTAAAMAAAITGGAMFIALALLLHSPREAKESQKPYYAGETGADISAS